MTIGMLTTLLPCGWLWAFAVTAAGTASPLIGAAVMAAFWIGTLPMLVALGAGMRQFARRATPRLALLMSILIVLVGLYTIYTRAGMSIEPVAAAATPTDAAQQVRMLSPDKTCCKPQP